MRRRRTLRRRQGTEQKTEMLVPLCVCMRPTINKADMRERRLPVGGQCVSRRRRPLRRARTGNIRIVFEGSKRI